MGRLLEPPMVSEDTVVMVSRLVIFKHVLHDWYVHDVHAICHHHSCKVKKADNSENLAEDLMQQLTDGNEITAARLGRTWIQMLYVRSVECSHKQPYSEGGRRSMPMWHGSSVGGERRFRDPALSQVSNS